MTLPARKPMTLAEFLEWEARQPLRYEFDGIGPVAMTGGTRAHTRIQRNLAVAVTNRLRGRPCEFLGSDFKFKVAKGNVRYPDGMIACTPGEQKDTMIEDPVVVFEVLSASTAGDDLTIKAPEYEATPSVQRYVMLEQDRIGAIAYFRSGDLWTHEVIVGDSPLPIPEVDLVIPLPELYEGVVFDIPTIDDRSNA
jgi:Uma2 family endonuclease